ncbi:MAG: anthranilate synthase component I, partial [Dehalococcoidia bacterium]|nr:anthranilate synthase component I [Dehalococcoidia bacterium]
MPVFAELPADLDTPLSAYLRLRPGPYSFLLESVEGGEVWARYSFLGTDPLMVLTAKNGRITLRRGTGRAERLPDGDPLVAVRDLLRQFQPVPVPGLPRFQGGAVGYLAYDMVRHMERLPRTTRDDLGLPDAVFLFTDTLLVFDNLRHRV